MYLSRQLPSTSHTSIERFAPTNQQENAIADIYSHAILGLIERPVSTASLEPGLAWLVVKDPSVHSGVSHYVRGLVKIIPVDVLVLSLFFLTQLPVGRHDYNTSPELSADMVQLRNILLRGSIVDRCYILHTFGVIMALKIKNDMMRFKHVTSSPEKKKRLSSLDRLAWRILWTKANVKALDWMQMLESVAVCGGPLVRDVIGKMMAVAASFDASATSEVQRIFAMSNAMGPAEDLTERFIMESQLAEERAAIARHAASSGVGSPPPPSLALGLTPSYPLPPTWTSAISENPSLAAPLNTFMSHTAIDPTTMRVTRGSPIAAGYGCSAYGTIISSPLTVALRASRPASEVPEIDIGDYSLPSGSPLPLAAPPSTPVEGPHYPRPLDLRPLIPTAEGQIISPITPSPLSMTSPSSMQSGTPVTPIEFKKSPVLGQAKEARRTERKSWSFARLFKKERALMIRA
ncbi:hypothetical protein FRB97_002111 [Tulasnella sp. 331]|nr:hypothetical protein FRB97_002111 [Tulasnella sp. 331]KAG8883031.1 hypothetical protein FRB98_003354 [Tulasnella sp. 332]